MLKEPFYYTKKNTPKPLINKVKVKKEEVEEVEDKRKIFIYDEKIVQNIVSKTIRKLREEKRFTLRELAKHATISFQYLQRLETINRNVSLTTLYKILNCLEITLEDFFKEVYIELDKNGEIIKMNDFEIKELLDTEYTLEQLPHRLLKYAVKSTYGVGFINFMYETFIYECDYNKRFFCYADFLMWVEDKYNVSLRNYIEVNTL